MSVFSSLALSSIGALFAAWHTAGTRERTPAHSPFSIPGPHARPDPGRLTSRHRHMERLRRGFGGGAGAGAAARLNAMLDAEPDGAAQAHQEGSPMVDVVEDPVATAAGERGGQGEIGGV